MTCALCDYEMEWRDCDHCGGDGYLDGYEDDPINYAPGEDVPCHMCGGNGGEWICETKDCRTVVCSRIGRRHVQVEVGRKEGEAAKDWS